MQSITISWDSDTGAEPSNCFDGFNGKVFGLLVEPFDSMQLVWDRLAQTADGDYIIEGWEHDPETGGSGEPIDVPLKDVRLIRYL